MKGKEGMGVCVRTSGDNNFIMFVGMQPSVKRHHPPLSRDTGRRL